MKTLHALVAGGVVLSAVACSSSTNPAQGPVGGSSLTVEGVGSSVCTSNGYGGGQSCTYFFTPTPDSVATGATVNFKFDDVTHQVMFDTQGSPTDTLAHAANVTIPVSFATAGTYAYHCTVHPYMHGTVVVH
jgi:plastocyanin